MKDLIDAVVAFLEAARIGKTLSVDKVYKGLKQNQELIGTRTYVCVDEDGEETDPPSTDDSQDSQMRYYHVVIEFGAIIADVELVLDAYLDISNQVKAIVEDGENRQKDGHVWGYKIEPIIWDYQGKFYRGRRVIVRYKELEFTTNRY